MVVLNTLEPLKESAKSKQKRTSRLTLSSIKCWSDTDPDMPQFTTMDEFDIAKSAVLKASACDTPSVQFVNK